MESNRISLGKIAVIAAIVALIATGVGPALRTLAQNPHPEKKNLRLLATAAQIYSVDNDDRIVLSLKGAWRDLQNVGNNELTTFGNERADAWPHLLMPYLASRATLLDPRRNDVGAVFAGPAKAAGDAGFDINGATFRNQSRFPYYGLNYQFLSPLRIPTSALSEPSSVDYMAGESRSLVEAEDPGDTVYFIPSKQFTLSPRGHFAANAPGMWSALVVDLSPYVAMWDGSDCSGDWCGLDIDAGSPGIQTSQSSTYLPSGDRAANVAMLDGHVRFLSLAKLTAGTNYFSAAPNDAGTGGLFGGGAVITDRSKHIWNLSDEFFALP